MNETQIAKLKNTDISTWDLSALRAEIHNMLAEYKGIVYTEADMKDAKKDRTDLGKFIKQIDDARKEYKKKCLAPYATIEPQLKELTEMIENQRKIIDHAIKDYEEQQKEEKQESVRKYYDRKAVILGDMADDLYKKIFKPQWVNPSKAKSKYEEEIVDAISKAAADIKEIKSKKSPFVDTLLNLYSETLSMDRVNEKQAELEEAARKASLTPIEEGASAIGAASPTAAKPEQILSDGTDGTVIRIFANRTQLNQILDFMKAIGVRYECI